MIFTPVQPIAQYVNNRIRIFVYLFIVTAITIITSTDNICDNSSTPASPPKPATAPLVLLPVMI